MRAGDYIASIERLPLAPVESLIGTGTIVVLAPHPDDETLGCGGLMAAARSLGRRVHIVILTDGTGSHPHSKTYPASRLAALRREESQRAAEVLGLAASDLTFLGLKDAAAPHAGAAFDAAVGRIEDIIRSLGGAETLLVTWKHDPHCDHEAAASMAEAVAARQPGLRLWRYPIWGLHLEAGVDVDAPPPTGFRVDITPWLAAKRAAIACHASQMTNLIDDDPDGFRFAENTLAPFLARYERFIGPAA